MTVFVQSIGIVILFALFSIHTKAMVCLMGQEPDSSVARRYRWVIPVEDPCKCTEIRPGGINNQTPGRHFNVIYFDTLLVSNSPMEIRKWLNCSDAFPGNQVKSTAISTAINGDLMGSVQASQSVITTHATGNAPVTGGIPVTSFTCLGRANGGHYADPYNCTRFYQCDNGVAQHKSCTSGLHFNVTTRVCVHLYDSNCVL